MTISNIERQLTLDLGDPATSPSPNPLADKLQKLAVAMDLTLESKLWRGAGRGAADGTS